MARKKMPKVIADALAAVGTDWFYERFTDAGDYVRELDATLQDAAARHIAVQADKRRQAAKASADAMRQSKP